MQIVKNIKHVRTFWWRGDGSLIQKQCGRIRVAVWVRCGVRLSVLHCLIVARIVEVATVERAPKASSLQGLLHLWMWIERERQERSLCSCGFWCVSFELQSMARVQSGRIERTQEVERPRRHDRTFLLWEVAALDQVWVHL